jgi:hypothetical protein
MMKKITLFAVLVMAMTSAYAQSALSTGQDTLLYQSFNYTSWVTQSIIGPPSAHATDTAWYTYDRAGWTDGSGQNPARPGYWFQNHGTFWPADSVNNPGIIMSNSWFAPAATADDWLITPNVYISDTTAKLHWKSATRQTPYYLDGYEVRLSTVSNSDGGFADLLWTGAEYVSRTVALHDSSYAYYTFSTPGYVQGLDHTYIGAATPMDSARFIGKLQPHTVSLAPYVGHMVFVAFHHDSHDDNLISLDDILITGTGVMGIKETINKMALTVFPNPTTDFVQINYNLPTPSSIMVNIYDMAGKLVRSESKGLQAAGQQTLNMAVADLGKGQYSVVMTTAAGKSTAMIVVQ